MLPVSRMMRADTIDHALPVIGVEIFNQKKLGYSKLVSSPDPGGARGVGTRLTASLLSWFRRVELALSVRGWGSLHDLAPLPHFRK